jgi:hypothetical protein
MDAVEEVYAAAGRNSGRDPHSAGVRIEELIAGTVDLPGHAAAFAFSAAMATDVTTGNAVVYNGYGNGFGLQEITPGERAFAAGFVFLPELRGFGVADDFAKLGQGFRQGDRYFGAAPFRINPTGGSDNCVSCVIALDRTLGGNPSSALPISFGTLDEITHDLGGHFIDVYGPMHIGSILSQAGDGARGVVAVTYRSASVGHVFNAVNDSGTIRFLDGQSGLVPERVLGNFDNAAFIEFLLTSPRR